MSNIFSKDFDLMAALKSDDGVRDVRAALDEGLTQVRRAIDKGLSPAEFKTADAVRKAFEAARDALEVLPTFARA